MEVRLWIMWIWSLNMFELKTHSCLLNNHSHQSTLFWLVFAPASLNKCPPDCFPFHSLYYLDYHYFLIFFSKFISCHIEVRWSSIWSRICSPSETSPRHFQSTRPVTWPTSTGPYATKPTAINKRQDYSIPVSSCNSITIVCWCSTWTFLWLMWWGFADWGGYLDRKDVDWGWLGVGLYKCNGGGRGEMCAQGQQDLERICKRWQENAWVADWMGNI